MPIAYTPREVQQNEPPQKKSKNQIKKQERIEYNFFYNLFLLYIALTYFSISCLSIQCQLKFVCPGVCKYLVKTPWSLFYYKTNTCAIL